MHGRHVDLSLADQMVKNYIGFVAGNAAPYPPPSDPRLSDIGSRPYPPPSAWVQPVRCISSSLAPGHYFRFGFGPIIRLQLRLEPLFLAGRERMNLHGSTAFLSDCAACCAVQYSPRPSAVFVVPLLQGQTLRLLTPGPAHPLGRCLFVWLQLFFVAFLSGRSTGK
jgi:hypothetical protein